MELTEAESIVLDYCLSFFPYYGDFSLINKIEEVSVTINMNPDLKTKFDSLYNDGIHIYEYMVDNGFAIKRNDSPEALYTQIELTERGRNLKKLGSLLAFQKNEVQAELDLRLAADLKRTETERSKFQFYISVSLAISTGVAAVYYLLEIFDYLGVHHLNRIRLAYYLAGVVSSLVVSIAIYLLGKVRSK